MDSTDIQMTDAETVYTDEPARTHRDYAWTVNGYAYDSQVPAALHGQILACYEPKAIFPTKFSPAPLQPSSTELATDNMPFTGIWIGMYIRAKSGDLGGTKVKSSSIADRNDPECIEKTENALRVVMLQKGNGNKFTPHALANPDGSCLCVPFVVKLDSVFFFRKFRDPDDSLTSVQSRNKTWSANVRALLPRSDAKDRFEGPLTLSLPRGDAFVTDAHRLYTGYTVTGDIEYLKRLRQLIKDRLHIVDEDQSQSSVFMYKALNTTTKSNFNESEIQLLHSEILNHWPDLETTLSITSIELAVMCKAVSLAEVCVDPMFNRAFVVLLCKEFRKLTPEQLADDEGLVACTEECHHTVELMFGCENPQSRPKSNVVDDSHEQLYLQTVKQSITSILSAARSFDEKRKSEMGPIRLGLTSKNIFEDAMRAGDYDAMKSALQQARRLDLEHSLSRDDVVFKMLDELVALLNMRLESL